MSTCNADFRKSHAAISHGNGSPMGRPWGKRKELLQQMGAGSFEYGGPVRLPNGRSAYVVLRDGKPFKRYYNHDKAMQFLDLRRDDMEGRAMRKRYNPLPAANVAESDLGAEVVRAVVAKAGDEEVIDEFAERWQNVIDSGKSTRKEQVAQRYFISKFRQLYQQGKIKGQKAKVAYAITQAAAYRVMLEDGRLTGVEAISDPLVREMFIGADGTLIPLGRDQHNRASPLVKVRDALKRGIRTSAVDWLSPHVPFPSEPKAGPPVSVPDLPLKPLKPIGMTRSIFPPSWSEPGLDGPHLHPVFLPSKWRCLWWKR